ncbi:MAG TPA: DUF4157 domain-containing protein, partial [Pyrinomonadaceae bacterium]|nr:DUF4157 domain-containing protein [Pyrinomonadaceae bacterium]
TQSARRPPAAHPLLALQISAGNWAVQRLIGSPCIQAKLQVSTPSDPSEREADRVAETVMRMAEPQAARKESPDIQTQPPITQIHTLTQRAPAQPLEEEKEKEKVVAPEPIVQRAPVAVREDEEEEEKVAPKLEAEVAPPEEEKDKTADRKPTPDAPLQRQTREDEEKREEAAQVAPAIQRQAEDEDKQEVQRKLLSGQSPQPTPVSPIRGHSHDGVVQRLCTQCEGEEERAGRDVETVQRKSAPAPQTPRPYAAATAAANIRALHGGGSPLPETTRAFFERRFVADFSQVRVHTGAHAIDAAKAINARAFTAGRNIAFGPGQYAPHSHEGQRLLAHELTHVVQQGAAGPAPRAPVSDGGTFIQRQEAATAPTTPAELIKSYTSFLGNLDEAGLGRDLAQRLPGQAAFVLQVFNLLSGSDQDDLAYEITMANLGGIPESLGIKFIEVMVTGVTTEDEEGAVANLWIKFGIKAAESHRELWKKSLAESEQLRNHVKPVTDAFAADVTGLAQAYLAQNKVALLEEAKRYGIDLEGGASVAPTEKDYLKEVREMVPGVIRLQNFLDEMRKIHVGYGQTCDREGCTTFPVDFNPEYRPNKPPEDKNAPTWEMVKEKYDLVSALISAFASHYPSIYLLIQQGNLKKLNETDDAAKAQAVILETMQKTAAKIAEAQSKIGSDISHYDLKIIQGQLLGASAAIAYATRHPWDQPYYYDIAKYDLEREAAKEFWIGLGLTFLAAAALIAAPFTGGATAAFLVGFGIGVGAGQAAVSWEKYLDKSTVADATVRKELALISQGEVTAQMVEAIILTVGTFLDVYGAAKGATAATKKGALELAEQGLKKELAEAAEKRALGEAGEATSKKEAQKQALKRAETAAGGEALEEGEKKLASQVAKKFEEFGGACAIGSIKCRKLPETILAEAGAYPKDFNVPFPSGSFNIQKAALSGVARGTELLRDIVRANRKLWPHFDKALKAAEKKGLDWVYDANGKAWEVHHIKQVNMGGTNAVGNLFPLPHASHVKYTAWFDRVRKAFERRFTPAEWDLIYMSIKDVAGSKVPK